MRVPSPLPFGAASYSRRRFFGCGAAGVLMAQAGLAQTIAPPTPGEPADDAARIAARNDTAQRLTIPVTVNGRGPYRFVVDTGADRSVIADDVAVNLGLVRGRDVVVQGVVRSLGSRLVDIGNLEFGSLRHQNLLVPVLPRSLMQADGYLGLDAVDGSRVTLNFQDRSLEIGKSRPLRSYHISHPSEAYVPVGGSMGHLRSVDCRVDGVRTTCFLDTGAEISVGNSRLFEALLAKYPDYQVVGTLPITGVTGGIATGKVVRLGRIHLHSIDFSQALVAIADMQIFDVWGLSKEPALLIGMNFLRQFAQVSIDYGLKEIRFDLASIAMARAV